MKSSSGILKGIIAFVVIAFIGIGIGWFFSRHKPTAPITPPPTEATTAETSVSPQPAIPMAQQSVVTNEVAIKPEMEPEPADLADKISDILGDDTEITNKVEALLELYPRLTTEGKQECIEHLTNLVGDEEPEYAPLAKILVSTDVPPGVATHLLGELINRPKALMMPLYLQVATNPDHPGRKEALDTLETFLDDDYSEDPTVLSNSVVKWLEDNPD